MLRGAAKLGLSQLSQTLVVLGRQVNAKDLCICRFLLSRHTLFGNLPHMSDYAQANRQDLSRGFRLASVRAVQQTMRDYLGQAIRVRRKELDLGQEELAERMGCSSRTISRYEAAGEKDAEGVAFVRLEKIADALETTPAKLLSMALGLSGYRPEAQPASDDLRETLTELVAGSTEMKAQLAAMQIELEEIGKTVKRS